MMTEPTRELTPEEHERGKRLMRSCDALTLLEDVLDHAYIPNLEDKENARKELERLSEEAHNRFLEFKREHGIPEPEERRTASR